MKKRWLRSYTNYRGYMGSDVQFTEAEKSRVFIKVTKTKTFAAYGQIVDVLFAGNKFPISVDPTSYQEGWQRMSVLTRKNLKRSVIGVKRLLRMALKAMVWIFQKVRLKKLYQKILVLSRKARMH